MRLVYNIKAILSIDICLICPIFPPGLALLFDFVIRVTIEVRSGSVDGLAPLCLLPKVEV
jgi:hypothetical protein